MAKVEQQEIDEELEEIKRLLDDIFVMNKIHLCKFILQFVLNFCQCNLFMC